MNRFIKYAKLHGGDAFIPGIGHLGGSLPPQGKTFKAFSMLATTEGLAVDGTTDKGAEFSCLFPWAGVQIAVFQDKAKAVAAA